MYVFEKFENDVKSGSTSNLLYVGKTKQLIILEMSLRSHSAYSLSTEDRKC